jgi:hypothetical protein
MFTVGFLVRQQLDVRLRAGLVELSDLPIKAEAVNELLIGKPVKVARGSIRALKVNICYDKLLSDSFTVGLEGVDIVLVPNAAGMEAEAASGGEGWDGQCRARQHWTDRLLGLADGSATPEAESRESFHLQPPYELRGAGAEDTGLDIIAEWIEQILSKIKVSIRDLKVRAAARPCAH